MALNQSLKDAVKGGDVGTVKRLLKTLSNEEVIATDKDNATAFSWAAYFFRKKDNSADLVKRYFEICKLFVADGRCDIDQRERGSGDTPRKDLEKGYKNHPGYSG